MKGHSASKAQLTGQIIRDARKLKGLKQEKLAEMVDVSIRTVGKWENGKISPTFDHRKALVNVLGIDPELLDMQREKDLLQEEVLSRLESAEESFNQGFLVIALSNANLLVYNLIRKVKLEDTSAIIPLIRTYYLKGYAVGIVNNDPQIALKDFKAMESLASKIQNQAWFCIAKMYQAEMYRRMDDPRKALRIFKKVFKELNSDNKLVGHYQQLLARVYIALDDVEEAMNAISEAKKYAIMSQKQSSNLAIFFDLYGVYVDCADMHMKLCNFRSSLNYIFKAESIPQCTPYLLPAIKIIKGALLMNMAVHADKPALESILDDPDYLEGKRLFAEGYQLAVDYGDQRLVQYARNLVNSFGRRGNRNIRIAQDLGEDVVR